jgi:lipoprotein-anchoring transpeptidase ErfK/SrfK
MRERLRPGNSRRRGAAGRTALPARVITLAALALISACGTTGARATRPARAVAPVRVSAAELARLPGATTYATSPTAPRDPDPFMPEPGIVLHPTVRQVVYTRPGGPPVATLPVTELSNPTWVPVVQSQRGWDRILLPTRPNHSTGWIYLGHGGLRTAYSAFRVVISLAARRLTVLDAGHSAGSWTVAVGARGTPTPTGRTFVLASLAPARPAYSPLILPLGTHSGTLTTFGGGPGTVALHGWPNLAVFGHAVSHGCVRVPSAALRMLSRVPLGSPVMIVG